MKTRFDTRDGDRVNRDLSSERAFALSASALALAMLTLFGVLALADVVGLPHMLPFVVLPPALLVVSALFLRRWATDNAEASTAQEVVQREKARR